MKIEAAITREKDAPFSIERVDLAAVRRDEMLIRLAATGICHTDLATVHQEFPIPLPYVLGHEGSGVVMELGSDVRDFRVGDHVVLTFESCGICESCAKGHPAYCHDYGPRNFGRQRPDGEPFFIDNDGVAIAGRYLGQSSFATHAIATPRNAVKVRSGVPLEMLPGFGCGFMTGAAAVMNVIRPRSKSTFAVLGAGALGFAALFAAKIAGCERIVMVDRVGSRLRLASELGASEVIDTGVQDLAKALGSLDYVVDTTGFGPLVACAVQALNRRGTVVLLGGSRSRIAEIDVVALLQGKVLRGEIFGDADPHVIIPHLIDLYVEGRFPVDRLIRKYSFAQINEAAADASSGVTIKPVLLF